MKRFNESGRADVYSDKAEPHVEYVRGNYWLRAVRRLFAGNLRAVCRDNHNNGEGS